jgi:hypothetical protein
MGGGKRQLLKDLTLLLPGFEENGINWRDIIFKQLLTGGILQCV